MKSKQLDKKLWKAHVDNRNIDDWLLMDINEEFHKDDDLEDEDESV